MDKGISKLIASIQETADKQEVENTRKEKLEEIKLAISNQTLNLSKDQVKGLHSVKESLQSNKLKDIEQKREANDVAEATLSALKKIEENTEKFANIDFSKGARGLFERLGVVLPSLAAGLTLGAIEGYTRMITDMPTFKKLAKSVGTKLLKVLSKLGNAIIAPFRNITTKVSTNIVKPFTKIGMVLRALGDLWKKAGTGWFLKGNTKKVFNQDTIKSISTGFLKIKNGIERIGLFMENIRKSGFYQKLSKVIRFTAKYTKMAGSLFVGLLKSFKFGGGGSFMGDFKTLKSSFTRIKEILGFAGKESKGIAKILKPFLKTINILKGVFRVVGRILGRFLAPLMAVFKSVKVMIDEWNNSELSGLGKIIDVAITGLGGFAAGFIGGLIDLIKDGLSWILDTLGFDAASEWLDSFSISDMVIEGMSNLADMIGSISKAMLAGAKAAINPTDGLSFTDAFAAVMAGQDPSQMGNGNLGEKANERFIEAKSSERELQAKIKEEQARITRSESGENEYFGPERKGIEASRLRIMGLQEKLAAQQKIISEEEAKILAAKNPKKVPNTSGALMEATTSNTADMKAAQGAASAAPVVIQGGSSQTNNSSQVTIAPSPLLDKTVTQFQPMFGLNPI